MNHDIWAKCLKIAEVAISPYEMKKGEYCITIQIEIHPTKTSVSCKIQVNHYRLKDIGNVI